ncbi:hypothetical protein C4F50_12110 [Flavobacterium sp. KB82]|uniref:Lipoprotein n=2 Tax=Flavobacterium hungaricum TaxID=2082725 RepID=A0ABR9TK18_9FLAO|nr:hypothetical protein [Flavobacterium hungaricum]
MITSCNSQTDLEKIKLDTNVSSIVKDSTKFEKENDVIFPFISYETNKVNNYSFGKLSFTNYRIEDTDKNSLINYESRISFFVDNYESNKLLGFAIRIEKEDEGNDLFNYVKNKLGKPLKQNVYNKDNHVQSSYLWDDKARNQLIYIKQNTEYFSNEKNKFISTELAVFKRGLKLNPDEGTDSQKIKNLLDENPNAFDVLEILKNRFQN